MEHARPSRRDFLKASSLTVGLSLNGLPALPAAIRKPAQRVVQICLLGGPSQLDTWDPKPDAAAEIRGPYRSIQTNVPGIRLSEHFPRLARMADRFALLRTLYHHEAPIHETGLQLTQTGRLFAGGQRWPHFGEVLDHFWRGAADPHFFILPKFLLQGCTGGAGDPGQSGDPQYLLEQADVENLENQAAKNSSPEYGRTRLGALLETAFTLLVVGVPAVTVNMFNTVFGQTTWDCHANGGDLNSTLADYGRTLCPMLDQALSAFLDDLVAWGLLDSTLVVCLGEFGRTPRVNANGGRDHWPRCWTGLVAGGGIRGGQVIGRSDDHAAEPKDRPIHASEIVATIYHALGIDPQTRMPGPDGQPVPLVEAAPIRELF